jgi:hypothetical protein
VTDCDAGTAKVLTVNLALVEPAGIVTDAGTVAAFRLELVSVTVAPPDGATPVSVTVPVTVVEDPPTTLEGVTVTPMSVDGEIVRIAVFVTTPSFAVIVTLTVVDTAFVAIVKVAEEAPAGIFTEPRRTVSVLFVERLTVTPAGGAAPVKVTVPVTVAPPPTFAGDSVTDAKVAG